MLPKQTYVSVYRVPLDHHPLVNGCQEKPGLPSLRTQLLSPARLTTDLYTLQQPPIRTPTCGVKRQRCESRVARI